MPEHPRIAALGTAVPPHRWSQRACFELLADAFPAYRDPRIEQVFMNGEIEHRHFTFAPGEFDPRASADDLHRRFALHSVLLSHRAIERALEQAGAAPEDVDFLVVATCTGYLCPGLTPRLIRALGMRDDVQRCDLVGMGCAGAMPALQRAHDFVRAHPSERALAVTVEICSACWFVDESLETAVGNAICADGAAAALVVGAEAPVAPSARGARIGAASTARGPEILRFETLLDTDQLGSVGFEFEAGRLRIVLDKELRRAAGPMSHRAVERLLSRHGIEREAIRHWVIHSGGRRVLDGIERAFEFAGGELDVSRAVLREHGNMSSPTVMFVLDRTCERSRPARGELGVMLALGPGLAAETALLRW